jgi:catechol 2,3-dioxygenase-like lactoylglutathione lyase family enzyme
VTRGRTGRRSAPKRARTDRKPAGRAARKAVSFEGVTPVLRVRSLAASLRHYVGVLGFRKDWGGEKKGFASVSRGDCHIFLAQGDQGHSGSWVWVGVSDAAALHEEYRRRGARIRHPPTNYEWALEMQVEDVDGNVLRMGSEPLDGEPTGEWLDMEARRWRMRPDGSWRRTR